VTDKEGEPLRKVDENEIQPVVYHLALYIPLKLLVNIKDTPN
jgi:hypothetical protein